MTTEKQTVIRYVVVGGGPAGVHAALTIRSHDPHASIKVLHGESDYPYYRKELDSVIGGTFSAEQLPLYSESWYQEQAIDFQLNAHVAKLFPANNYLVQQTGDQIAYDVLLLATGATPNRGAWPGQDLKGVLTLRTWKHAQAIMAAVRASKPSVVIVGGGLLGLTLAESLLLHAQKLTIIEQAPSLWSPIFDQKASEFIARESEKRGIEILVNEQVREFVGDTEGVKAVSTSTGNTLEADLVFVAIGVRPAIDFLEGSGIHVDRGVLIDHEFKTNVGNIFAAGDVAQAYDAESGRFQVVTNWQNAVEQGRLAGAAMTGASILYPGVLPTYSESLFGIPVMMIGRLSGKGRHVTILVGENSEKGIYRKIVLKEGKIIGALFLGNNSGVGMIQHFIREKKTVDLLEVKSTFLTGLLIEEIGRK